MESKGHNRPTRISNHGKSIKPKKESSKGNGHVEKTDRDKAKSSEEKQMLENGSNHMLDDGGEHEQQAEEKGSVSETNTDGNVNTETANNTNGGTDATERTNPVDTNGEQYEYVEHDNDEKWTTDEGNVNPLTSATPTDPEDFDSRSFLQGVGDLQARLRSVSSRSDTDGQFPADELMALVQDATTTLNNFKDYSVHSQTQMEELRHDMEEVGHRIVKQIQKRVHVTVDKTSELAQMVELLILVLLIFRLSVSERCCIDVSSKHQPIGHTCHYPDTSHHPVLNTLPQYMCGLHLPFHFSF